MEQLNLFLLLLGIAYIYPIGAIIKQILIAYKEKDRSLLTDLVICFFLFIGIVLCVFYIFISMDVYGDPYMPVYFWVIYGAILILWILIFIFTLLHKGFRLFKSIDTLQEEYKSKNSTSKIRIDTKRKTSHFIFYILLWVGFLIVRPFIYTDPNWNELQYASEIWDYNVEGQFYWINLLQNPNLYGEGCFLHLFLMIIFIISSYYFTMFELIRHSNMLYLPVMKLLFPMFRLKEFDGVASNFHFFLSMTITTFFLPPLLTICVAGVGLFGDLMASQFGMRWGVHHYKFNKKKTYLGTIAGTVSSFLISALFLGTLYGAISAFVFMLTDLFTEKPIRISDNLATPLLLTLVFILANIVGINYLFPDFLLP
ncbi:MAG: hypothetical protein GF364_10520 [Candidatus Lokiarchaeota archaeon]|nr:hypothetical protein [Candidatus Lokiarchaeota archaeon]